MLKLHFDMSNDSFADCGATECARILRALAERIETEGGFSYLPIKDSNGNRVGELTMTATQASEE